MKGDLMATLQLPFFNAGAAVALRLFGIVAVVALWL